ncbi:13961_t:CDS:10 [Entrophospora sp. SA101]|nr:13961_t:CDS:10 [Entrophospora sp. SA101]
MTSRYFTECHYSRFSSGGRTNIYGLSILKTFMKSGLPRDQEFPSNITKTLHDGDNNALVLNHQIHNNDDNNNDLGIDPQNPNYHIFISSFYGITCFVSAAGYWNTLELPLDNSIGEIISIEVFSTKSSILILSITTTGPENNNLSDESRNNKFFLRIFSLTDDDDSSEMYIEEALFKVTEQCQLIELGFAPMQLLHSEISHNGESFDGLMLCGTDGGIHLYTENEITKKWEERSIQQYYPLHAELGSCNSNVLSLEIKEFHDIKIIAAGCQNGTLYLSIMKKDLTTGNYVQVEELSSSVVLPSSITSICIFSSSTSKDKKLFNNPFFLSDCSEYDSVLCSNVMDVDWDGKNEIMVGTYGRELLIYKQELIDDVNSFMRFKLLWKKSFAYPIYKIVGLDLNQDCINELIIVTQYGVHVLQPRLDKAKYILFKKLEELNKLYEEYKNLE